MFVIALRSSHGFTMIELMVALALGLVVMASGISLLLSTLSIDRELLRVTRLNQDLRQVLNVMQRDIARAGHWSVGGTVTQIGATYDLHLSGTSGNVTVRSFLRGTSTASAAFGTPLSPAVLLGRTLTIAATDADGNGLRFDLLVTGYTDTGTLSATIPSGPPMPDTVVPAGSWSVLNPFSKMTVSGDCLLFSYDEDSDGVRGDLERFGYRYDAAGQSIQAVNNTDSCGAGAWQSISDKTMFRVTGLQFLAASLAVDAGKGLRWTTREITLAIAAVLVSDATADRSLQGSVEVRNLAVE